MRPHETAGSAGDRRRLQETARFLRLFPNFSNLWSGVLRVRNFFAGGSAFFSFILSLNNFDRYDPSGAASGLFPPSQKHRTLKIVLIIYLMNMINIIIIDTH